MFCSPLTAYIGHLKVKQLRRSSRELKEELKCPWMPSLERAKSLRLHLTREEGLNFVRTQDINFKVYDDFRE